MISVIIPIFNNEKFLPQLFSDIKAQTFKDFEVVFVNDGSKDNSQQLLQDFCKGNNYATCYFQENSGVSSARNFGLKQAKGEYIVFWDADDFIDKDFLKIMYYNLKENTLTVSGFSFIDENNKKVDTTLNIKTPISKNQIAYLQENWLFNALWNKIFLKEIIDKNNIEFNKDFSVGEDALFIANYVKHVQYFLVVDSLLYTYVRRQNSAMTKYHKNIYFTHSTLNEQIIESLDNSYEDYKECLKKVKENYGKECVSSIWHLVANVKNGSKQELKMALKHYNTNKNLIKPKVNFVLKILLKIKNITLLKIYQKVFL